MLDCKIANDNIKIFTINIDFPYEKEANAKNFNSSELK